jgi:ABC-type sugar transport system permease subunit
LTSERAHDQPASKSRLREKLSRLPHDIYLQIAGVTLVAPAVFLLCLLIVGPFVYVVWESLFAEGSTTAGLANYRWFLGGTDVWPTFKNGLKMTAGSVALEVVVAVPLALLLNQRIPGRNLFRGRCRRSLSRPPSSGSPTPSTACSTSSASASAC